MRTGFQVHGSLVSLYCLFLQLFYIRKLDSLSSQRATIGHILMTRSTEGHRFPFQGYHPFDPFRLAPSWVLVEIFHGSYMMDFYILCGSAEFTVSREKSLHEF